jgi:hypothetical protein
VYIVVDEFFVCVGEAGAKEGFFIANPTPEKTVAFPEVQLVNLVCLNPV